MLTFMKSAAVSAWISAVTAAGGHCQLPTARQEMLMMLTAVPNIVCGLVLCCVRMGWVRRVVCSIHA